MPYPLGDNLIDSLVPTVDALRTSLHGFAGDRAYKVWQVRTRWSGQRRGEGNEIVVSETELIPTPRVDGVGGLDAAMHAVGRDEEGVVYLSEISLTMSEDEVSPLTGSTPIPVNENCYYEIRFSTGKRRRFTPTAAPERDSRTVGWRLALIAQDNERNPSGTVFR